MSQPCSIIRIRLFGLRVDFSLTEDGLDLVEEGMSWFMSTVSQPPLLTRTSRRSG